jgi:S1-C subfamily serine protease
MYINKGKIVKKIEKLIPYIIIVLLLISTFFIHSDVKKPSYSYLRDVTVFIKVMSPENIDMWSGTGVVVKITEDYTYILTNRHVAPMEQQGNVYVKDLVGTFKSAEVLKNSEEFDEDMSLIRVRGTVANKRCIKGIKIANIQDRVFMAGNNGGKLFIYREGFISGYSGMNFVMQLPVRGGDSGTGVIDKNGYLVGLVFALELDYGYLLGQPIVLAPNHTLSITMTGTQIKKFLQGEI